jgi:hypothetical protein
MRGALRRLVMGISGSNPWGFWEIRLKFMEGLKKIKIFLKFQGIRVKGN